jgi:predicted flap endonuclease-1-like 5' DNA nuclease
VLEKKLNSLGIKYYRQIAVWSDADVKHFAEQLAGFPDRIVRDRWVERAAEEHQAKYGEALSRTVAGDN